MGLVYGKANNNGEVRMMEIEFVDCCSKCGDKRYAIHKPFRELGAITISMEECKLCNGANKKKGQGVVYAIDWKTMCRKADFFD